MSSEIPTTPKPKRKAEPIGLRAIPHAPISFMPASASDEDRILAKGVKPGDLVFVDFRKPRNGGFHRLAHAIGRLAVENIEDFSHLTPHEALKRLQMESGTGCELMLVNMSTIWLDVLTWIRDNFGEAPVTVLKLFIKNTGITQKLVPVKIPRSMSYDSMDEGEFREAITAICKFMATRYWPSCNAEEIEAMAQASQKMVDS